MAGLTIHIDDHVEDVLRELRRKEEAALEAASTQLETLATTNVNEGVPRRGDSWYTPKGTLARSITHLVDMSQKAGFVGSNDATAIYNELGTGNKGSGGGGYWVYVPGGSSQVSRSGKRYTEQEARRIVAILRSKGLDAHMTQGMKPLHFLKKAGQDNAAELVNIMKRKLEE